MLFEAPQISDIEREVLGQIEELRASLKWQLNEPRRWVGSLRRMEFARGVQGSNSIEGFVASLDDAAAIDLGEEPLDADQLTCSALKGYRDAMTYVLALAEDEEFVYSDSLLKSLHFMMTGFDLSVHPGRWRGGPIYVVDERSGALRYEGPDRAVVPELIAELIAHLNTPSQGPALIDAAMAHLNLVMIHPFRDGNGRMARCLQSLVLAREGFVSPIFASVEEYLGDHTPAYYDVLQSVGGVTWQPERDARPWVRFMLLAHLHQARLRLARVQESEELWGRLDRLVGERRLPVRTVPILWEAAMGYRIRNAMYRAILAEAGDETISEGVATRDLTALVTAGLLVAHGEKRGRFYLPSKELIGLRAATARTVDFQETLSPFSNLSG